MQTSEAAQNCRILLSGHFKRASKNKSCQALAVRLGVGWKHIAMISNGGYCGQHTAAKLRRLVARPGSVRDRRKDAPRLYVPFPHREQIQFIENYTSAQERREALLALAQTKAAATIPPAASA